MTSPLEDLRRTKFLHFVGSSGLDSKSGPGRIFPETDAEAEAYQIRAYRNEPNPEVRAMARTWVKAVKLICGVQSLSEVSGIFGETAREKGLTESEIRSRKKEIGNRCLEAFAQRHRIIISDMEKTSGIDYGITLSETRRDQDGNPEVLTMEMQEVKELMKLSLGCGREVRGYLHHPHSGILRGMSNVMPSLVNEPLGIANFADLLLLMFSTKWGAQTRFEARQILGFADMAAEVLLYRKRYEGLKDNIYNILDHHGVFDPRNHGPLQNSYNFITTHNPATFYVEGVEYLPPGKKYEPLPNLLFNRLTVRRAIDSDGEYLLQLNDDPKGIIQTMLKMIRRNTMDPAEIRDNYRMAAIFINHADIDRFLTAIKEASRKAGQPIIVDEIEFEDTLDGDVYEANTAGVSERYAGSSKKYQVMRRKLYFKDRPDLFWELSCYTLEAFVNYNVANNTNVLEYLVTRLIMHDPEKVDSGVFDYLVPWDIYNIDIAKYLNALVSGIRTSIRAGAIVGNEHMSRRPRLMDQSEIYQAVMNITHQIEPPSSTHKPNRENWPEIIIAIGKNTLTASQILSDQFQSGVLYYYPGNGQTLSQFIESNSQTLAGKRILILDDIGIQAKTANALSKELINIGIPSPQIAFLALQKDSVASKLKPPPQYGSVFSSGEYIFFPTQLHEHIQHTQSVFGVCYRYRNGQLQVLLQTEEKDGVEKVKLPGGTWNNTTADDESTMETLRRELDEELGSDMRRRLSARLVQQFPIEEHILLDPNGPDTVPNTLGLRAYLIDGQDLEIDDWQTPKNSNVKSLQWVQIDDAIDTVYREGYRMLLRSAKEKISKFASPESLHA